MDAHIVPSLEDIALEVSFKEIMATLILCYDHRPEGKRFSCLASPSAISKSFLTSEKLRSLVRSRLAQRLGRALLSQEVRGKYAKRFYDTLLTTKGENLTDGWVLLDAVLDNSIKELETHVAFPDSPPCSKLIPTVAKRSPLLKKLTINFELIMDHYGDKWKMEPELKTCIRPLRSLQHLTHLSLYQIWSDQRFTVLSLIGKACPSVSHLSVDGGLMGKRDLLALIFGEFVNDLMGCDESLWNKGRGLEHFVVPPEHLTPICSSIQELRLIRKDTYICCVDFYYDHNDIYRSEAAFLLRHLPLLKVVDKYFPTSIALVTTHQATTEMTEEDIICREKYQKAFQEALKRSKNTSPPPNFCATSFNGHLMLLTKLDFVNVKFEAMLKAVAATCPLLKEVTFCAVSFACDRQVVPFQGLDYELESNPIELDNELSPAGLKSILTGWPKLTKIGFHKVPVGYMTPILEFFGAELQHLDFKGCQRIKLADVALCHQLQDLRIISSRLHSLTFIPQQIDDSTVEAATFLLQLKSFESNVCLGHHSRLFEEKSTLVRLVLNCSHVDIKPESLRKRFKASELTSRPSEWDWIQQIWSRLEVLVIEQFTQLSLPVMSYIIPHLNKLTLVTLPQRISSYDPILFNCIRDHLLARNRPAVINLEEFKCYVRCNFAERT